MMAAPDASTASDRAAPCLTVHAPAKLNLTLRVLGRRSDGFHDIESFVVPIDLSDTLAFQPADGPSVELQCDAPEIPCGPENLVVRAIDELARRTGGTSETPGARPGWRVRLNKRIPTGAGLGGGSSDAAATLQALNRLEELGLTPAQLETFAAGIGSDVPFFLCGSAAIVAGRGERLTPVPANWPGVFLLIFPGTECRTARVYKHWEPGTTAAELPINPLDGPEPLSAAQLSKRLFNDLQTPAFRAYPQLELTWHQLEDTLRVPLHMTGSGSTLFCPADTPEQATGIAELVEQRFGYNTCITRLRV